ncbi:MAG: radical SAM protein [Promethearchaeati archaeon]
MKYLDLFSFFKEEYSGKKPIFHLFTQKENFYLYDTGTNKIIKCNSDEYDILKSFKNHDHFEYSKLRKKSSYKNSLNQIIQTIKSENILKTFPPLQFGLSGHFKNLESLINNRARMIQLEVTHNCNLRCRYCIYNEYNKMKRNHSDKNMPFSIATRAIKYLKEHSKDRDKLSITFYGGEPLLRFPFIKKCVEYSRKIITDKPISYSLTTNGTLMTKEIAKFFKINNFNLVFSIDGPKEIHDRYRIYKNGKGSFEDSFLGLKTALETFGPDEAYKRITLSMVYAPPYKKNRIDRISHLWDLYPFLPKKMGPVITYPSPGSIQLNTITLSDLKEDCSLKDWAFDHYDKFIYENKDLNPMARVITETKLARFMQRPLFKNPLKKYHLNGCCIPATRRLFVTVDGKFKVCERLPENAPIIGNVFRGVDMKKVKKIYVNEYANEVIKECSHCWAIQMCDMCYVHLFMDKKIGNNHKLNNCHITRSSTEDQLKKICEYLEFDKNSLNHLYEIEIT